MSGLPDIRRLFDLTGRVALVTGSSRGLGFEMARGYAAAGARVIVSSRKRPDCEAAAAEIRAQGGDASAFACHIGELDDVQAIADHVKAEVGQLDILVNNAAAALPYTLDAMTAAALDKSFAVNTRGPLLLIQALRPLLAASPAATSPDAMGAAIINVVSIGAMFGAATQVGYGASKAALWHATRSAAKALAAEKIRVNALAPGPMATRMVTSGGEKLMATSSAGTLQKRVADPSEIIGAAIFLASDASSFVTGTVLVVDGGWLA